MTFTDLIPTALCGLFMLITLISHLRTRQVIRDDARAWDARMAREIDSMTAQLSTVTYSAPRPEKTLEPRRNAHRPQVSA